MNTIQIELLFICLFGLCLGAYSVGKKKKINLVRCIGKSGSLVTLLLMVIEAILALRRGVDI
jgi:hypothetical protein